MYDDEIRHHDVPDEALHLASAFPLAGYPEVVGALWPVNDRVLQDLLAVRRETATLLGHDSWPDYDTEVKMIGSGRAVADFIEEGQLEVDGSGITEKQPAEVVVESRPELVARFLERFPGRTPAQVPTTSACDAARS